MRHLETADEGTLMHRILRAIGRCRTLERDLPLDDSALRSCLERNLAGIFRLLDRRLALEKGANVHGDRATPVHGILVDLLRDRQALATEHLFRLVGLLYPSEDARSLYRGVHDPSPKMRDSSRELLEHLLEQPLEGVVLALVDDISDTERLAQAQPYYQRSDLDFVGALGDMLDYEDPGMIALVAHHAGEIGAHALQPQLERLRSSSSATIVTAVNHALVQLSPPTVTPDGP